MALINFDDNSIFVDGDLYLSDCRRFGRALHTITQQGHSHVNISFENLTKAFAISMLPIVAVTSRACEIGIKVKLKLPRIKELHNLIINTNWAYFMTGEEQLRSTYSTARHVATMCFQDGATQHAAVEAIMNTVSMLLKSKDADVFDALSWPLNEMTDNVLAHSKSKSGGFVHATKMRSYNKLMIVVADAGIGIPKSLREGQQQIRPQSDSHALELAIRENVTSKPTKNQGNGLYGTYRIASESDGRFDIVSGHGYLRAEPGKCITGKKEIKFFGTVVAFDINFDKANILERALNIAGRQHRPALSRVDTQFLRASGGDLVIEIQKRAISLGSREAGKGFRLQLTNALESLNAPERIVVDFIGIGVISSSFPDEVFGMLFVELGALTFMSRFAFVNVDPVVQGLIDRAIQKRLAVAGN